VKTPFRIFRQEFAFEESLAAIQAAAPLESREHRIKAIVDVLPQPSFKTKERIAAKIIQRYFGGRRRSDAAPEFAGLLLSTRDSSVQRQLMLYRTARVDRIVWAVAAEVFYPYFVAKTYPRGFDEAGFRIVNTGTLFDSDDLVSARFVQEFARKQWGFRSASTINLALRVLKGGGVLRPVAASAEAHRSIAYLPTYASVSPEAFCYFLAGDLFSGLRRVDAHALDKVHNAPFVKLFMLRRPLVDSIMGDAAKRGWLRLQRKGRAASVSLQAASTADLVGMLTQGSGPRTG
jgi:hypothetical protein